MNITPWQMYWFTRLDGFKDFLSVISVVLLIGTIVTLLFAPLILDEIDDDIKPAFWMWIKRAFIVSFVSGFLFALVPSTREVASIYVIPKIVNNQKVQEIPAKILDLATAWLDHLKPESK